MQPASPLLVVSLASLLLLFAAALLVRRKLTRVQGAVGTSSALRPVSRMLLLLLRFARLMRQLRFLPCTCRHSHNRLLCEVAQKGVCVNEAY
jgi:hypothetical protein